MGDLAQYQPTEGRKKSWLKATNTPFDPIESLTSLAHHDIACPRCEQRNTARACGPFHPPAEHTLLTLAHAAYLTPEGTGYAQQGFQQPCAACGFAIDRPALAMDKFARDLVKEYAGDGAKLGAYLPCVHAPSYCEALGGLTRGSV